MFVNINGYLGIADKDNVFIVGLNKIEKIGMAMPIDPSKFGDAHAEKICNICHRILPTSDFQLNQNGKNNRQVRRPSCNNCRKKIDGISMNSSEKNEWQKTKPHLVQFTCPICDKTTIPGLTSKVVLNHDHATGKILGWLCDSCNTGLGRFKDDRNVLQKAIDYLDKFSGENND